MLLYSAIPLFLISLIIEFILDRYYKLNNYELLDSSSSIFMGLASLFISVIPHELAYPLFEYLAQYRLFEIEPTITNYIILIFLYDFSFYCSHRVSHRCRLFWASHVVHHSSEKYTLATALRQSWTDAIFNTLFYLYLPLLGFPLFMIINVRAINLIYQFWIHTEFTINLGKLEYLLNTPTHHKIHHASNQEYLDCNYGGMFIIYDRIFGTLTDNQNINIVYGITKPINTYNPLKIAFHEWIDMYNDCLSALKNHQFGNAFKYVFAPPGWCPKK
jgi:sterol desaturase/sphingolipid hydroxylase (fatty acid hydroxylase superfamily)